MTDLAWIALQAVESGEPFSQPLAIVLAAVLVALGIIAASLRSGVVVFAFAVAVVVAGLFMMQLISFSFMISGILVAVAGMALLGLIGWEVF